MNETEILQERYELALNRIKEIPGEHLGNEALEAYFTACAEFVMLLEDTRAFIAGDGLNKAPIAELAERNKALFADVLPEHYEESYANPTFAVKMLGEEFGQELCFLYTKLRQSIGAIYQEKLEEVVIYLELLTEVYATFNYAMTEDGELPKKEDISKILYWFESDYADVFSENLIRERVSPEDCFAVKMILESDLSDVRYLYAYGKYVTENELEMARFMAALPEETIATMADTYTEGYRIGFETTGKDLSKKQTVGLYYNLGFERMMRRAVENFAKMNLRPVCSFSNVGGGIVNRQYTFDHKDDRALFLDKNYVNRELEVTRTAYEKFKDLARGFAGPAVVETFGEPDFDPVIKKEALHMSKEQNRIYVEYVSKYGELTREYIPSEERSFTIIAFPIPEIGPVFRELFEETIRINTLDYMVYRDVQQTIIDALDTADYCEIKGMGENRTDLKVNLYKLNDPAKESIFENCVADVNIPVGEVFTSPVLEGTNGVLHVSRVFLDGLEYRNLAITFENGMIRDYSCSNFETEEENRNFIKENVLFRHDTLPLGEFAIGTNTTAYVVTKRLGVEAKMPILIAEKMGPHFAVGDTCYSHTEDIKVFNPDGKEIVARTNEVAEKRHTNPAEAYFNCHTDITIPYDELGELIAVQKDGSRVVIIKDGRFVLPGCEELNKAFEE